MQRHTCLLSKRGTPRPNLRTKRVVSSKRATKKILQTHLCVAVASLVGVDQSQRVQSTTLAIGERAYSALRQIRLEKVHALLHVATVNHANACRCSKLGPVARTPHPVEVIAKESVHLTKKKTKRQAGDAVMQCWGVTD